MSLNCFSFKEPAALIASSNASSGVAAIYIKEVTKGVTRNRLHEDYGRLTAPVRGEISVASPARNPFHQVECLGDVPATSLHIYGANIKALERNRWDEDSGLFVGFHSGTDSRRRPERHYLTPAGLGSALA